MPKASEATGIVAALDAFASTIDGVPVTVSRGDLFEADHPLVKKLPYLFGPVRLRYPVVRSVEQATAAPGEKRGA